MKNGSPHYPIVIALVLAIVACTQQRPVLYPNAHYKYVGKEIAAADTDEYIQAAIDFGAREDRGTKVAKDTATGSAVSGQAASMTRRVLKSGKPDPVFRRFVEQCRRDKGYQPIGWR